MVLITKLPCLCVHASLYKLDLLDKSQAKCIRVVQLKELFLSLHFFLLLVKNNVCEISQTGIPVCIRLFKKIAFNNVSTGSICRVSKSYIPRKSNVDENRLKILQIYYELDCILGYYSAV